MLEVCARDNGGDVRINKITFSNGGETCDDGVIVSGTDGGVEVSHDYSRRDGSIQERQM